METALQKTHNTNINEKQLIALLYSCPLCITKRDCVLYYLREKSDGNFLKTVKSLTIDEIIYYVSIHTRCFKERVKEDTLALNPFNRLKKVRIKPSLKWTGKGNLDFLTYELKKRNWIKSRNNFNFLFKDNVSDIKVLWHSRYKYELAYLLFKLKEEGFIQPVNSKGYFRIAEKQIVDFSGNPFRKNSLKKISSKISSDTERYADITKEVNNVIKKLL